jgi:hypothetical protein
MSCVALLDLLKSRNWAMHVCLSFCASFNNICLGVECPAFSSLLLSGNTSPGMTWSSLLRNMSSPWSSLSLSLCENARRKLPCPSRLPAPPKADTVVCYGVRRASASAIFRKLQVKATISSPALCSSQKVLSSDIDVFASSFSGI